ncbi:MAG: Clp protease N-terminal domain-containing protein [Nanoarchaeota archaeon]|nr:Clp protease N-terminal domain-containing protein [Nanoarchaeota archaeon]
MEMNYSNKFQNFTDRARKVMRLSRMEAASFSHSSINTAHILLGLIKEKSSIASGFLLYSGVDEKRVYSQLKLSPNEDQVAPTFIPLDEDTNKLLEQSLKISEESKLSYIGSEHLLYGLISPETKQSIGYQTLIDLGVNIENILKPIIRYIRSPNAEELEENWKINKRNLTLEKAIEAEGFLVGEEFIDDSERLRKNVYTMEKKGNEEHLKLIGELPTSSAVSAVLKSNNVPLREFLERNNIIYIENY